jgi:hypothetical protein
MAFVIRNDGGQFLGLYGWSAPAQAMRFSTKDDAESYNQKRRAGGTVTTHAFDDNRVPGVATDYDPFGLGTSDFTNGNRS